MLLITVCVETLTRGSGDRGWNWTRQLIFGKLPSRLLWSTPLFRRARDMPVRVKSHFSVPDADDKSRLPFLIDRKDKLYTKQYANLYWLRLVVLRRRVQQVAASKWSKLKGTRPCCCRATLPQK